MPPRAATIPVPRDIEAFFETPVHPSLLDLERDACRWPVATDPETDGHLFCGDSRARVGGPYCAEHEALAYVRPVARSPAKPHAMDVRSREAGARQDGEALSLARHLAAAEAYDPNRRR